MHSILLLASAVACSAPASDPTPEPPPGVLLELAPSVSVEVGRKCVLTATTTAKKVTWSVPPGADAMPLDGRRLAVWAPPGTYTFRAMVPNGDDVVATETVLTVTGPRPPPIPPVPPVVDPLIAVLQAAYDVDPSPTKSADKVALTAVFRVLAETASAPEVVTAKQLFDLTSNSITNRIGDRLKTVRAACGTELGKVLPATPSVALTQQNRDDYKKQTTRFADILGGIK
jgi:hypothetical protein